VKKLTEFRVVPLPTSVHAHIENRRKTLVYINSVRTLQHQIVPPPPPLASQIHYPKARDSIGNSTGLYLYAHKHPPLLPPPSTEDTQNHDPHATTTTATNTNTEGIEEIDDEDAWECVSCVLGHVCFGLFSCCFSKMLLTYGLFWENIWKMSVSLCSVNSPVPRDIQKIQLLALRSSISHQLTFM
jgi:hypothetical protein